MSVVEKTIECAACGGSVLQGVGREEEFCSLTCYRTGRAFCKQCGKPLVQSSNARKVFCNQECRRKYYWVKVGISPSPSDEVRRSTCKVCGNPIDQNIKGGRRLFCSPRCQRNFHTIERRGGDITQRWGSYAPETRRVLLELEKLGMLGTAKALAIAIDREYVRRKHEENRPRYVTCTCKACGKEFLRNSWGYQSREYCSDKCLPKQGWASGERVSTAKLTIELVEEIRRRYASEDISFSALGREYGVSKENIVRIVRYQTWNPKRVPEGKATPTVKLTWDQIGEIRNLSKTERMRVIAAQYGVSETTIWNIVHRRTWKPERDPRRKSEV